MSIQKIIGCAAVASVLFLSSCGPKDADLNQSVTISVQSAAPGVSSDVKEGVVTLSGQVNDESTRRAAEDAARNTKGVKSVVNNITIMAPPPPVVIVAPTDSLQLRVTDAVKDFPGVTATVNPDGEIVVNGEISADKWKRLKISLDALNPRKVTTVSLKIK
ncbi:MAG: transport-associated protein [Sediminibacterium sp.]|nr:transport-associated protein [Sediminibacterium sp.]